VRQTGTSDANHTERACGWNQREVTENKPVLQILLVTFPFFALVLAGFIAGRRGWLPLEAIPGLNGFVLYFALPCLLYRFGAGLPIAQLLDASVFFTYLLCALVMVGFAVAISFNARIGWKDASLGALVAAFPNTGFMGVPLIVALLGTAAAGPAIITITVDLLFTTSLCVALSTLDGADEHGASKALKNALKGVAINPMPWAILLGALASAIRLELPTPVAQTLGMLADAASPVALFTIGAVLARSQFLTARGHAEPLKVADYLPIAVLKLVVHPLLVLLVGTSAIQLGLPLSKFALTVMVLVAALPSASNVAMLAERFEADSGRIARVILVTTAAAFVTFSLAVRWVR
jgi:malonate transporter and related proteins